jgi:hypothetical protein
MAEFTVSAVFTSLDAAEKAIVQLRTLGISDSEFTVVTKNELEGAPIYSHEKVGVDGAEVAKGIGKGLLAGAGLGALMGAGAAMLIPGGGPFLAIGALAPVISGATAAAGATAGAIVGGTVGSLAGALGAGGYSHEESLYYSSQVERGGVLLSVHTSDPLLAESAREAMVQYHGAIFQAGADEQEPARA